MCTGCTSCTCPQDIVPPRQPAPPLLIGAPSNKSAECFHLTHSQDWFNPILHVRKLSPPNIKTGLSESENDRKVQLVLGPPSDLYPVSSQWLCCFLTPVICTGCSPTPSIHMTSRTVRCTAPPRNATPLSTQGPTWPPAAQCNNTSHQVWWAQSSSADPSCSAAWLSPGRSLLTAPALTCTHAQDYDFL